MTTSDGLNVDRLATVLNDLAEKLQPEAALDPSRQAQAITRRQVQVTAVNSNGTVDVEFYGSGVTIPGVAVQRPAALVTGDVVWIELAGTDAHVSGALSPPVWTDLTLIAGATNDEPIAHNIAQYAMLPGGMVGLRGRIKLGSASVGTDIATLPVGFRPQRATTLGIIHYNGSAWVAGDILVGTNGVILVDQATNSSQLMLDGLAFSIW